MTYITEIKLVDTKSDKEQERTFQIEYDDSTQQEATNLKELITKNIYTFSDLFNGLNKISFTSFNEPTTLYITSIESLKEHLSKKIPSYIETLTEPFRREDRHHSEVVLLKVILMDLYHSLGLDVDIPNSFEKFSQHVNATYTLLAAEYYKKENSNQFLDFLFSNDQEEEKRNLLFYLNDKSRFNLLNYLLHEQYQILIKLDNESIVRDNLLHNHLDEIIELIEQDFAQTPISEQIDSYQFPELSEEQLHELCIEFFKEIDPSNKWLEIYKRLHANQIVYIEKDETSEIDWCNYYDEGNGYIIIAPINGKITDFRDLVHEVTHIISLEQLEENDTISPSILEYPAIFMELQAIKFLRKKGYSQDVLDALYAERNAWTAANTILISPILRLLSRYLKEGKITLEKEQEYALQQIGDPSKLTDEDKELLKTYLPYEEIDIIAKCDEYNDFLILHKSAVLKEYPYTIGKYLAIKTMDKEQEDETTLPKVLEIISNLKNENPEGVIKKLDLDVIALSPDAKQYKKTRPE